MEKIITCLTGPSLSGKTTITNKLIENHNIILPKHTTTRKPRNDDADGFYNYISLNEFLQMLNNNEFIIGSTDGIRGYGVTFKDCETAFNNSDTLLLHVSYKDIGQLKRIDLPVRLVVLTYKYIELSMKERLLKGNCRDDIDYRISSALSDHENYFSEVQSYASSVIYTDATSIQETYKITCEAFGYKPNIRRRMI